MGHGGDPNAGKTQLHTLTPRGGALRCSWGRKHFLKMWKLETWKDPIALKCTWRTSLVVQWLRLHAPNAGGPDSIPGQGTRPHMPQLKILHATMKTWCSQINKYFLNPQTQREGRTNDFNQTISMCSVNIYQEIIKPIQYCKVK